MSAFIIAMTTFTKRRDKRGVPKLKGSQNAKRVLSVGWCFRPLKMSEPCCICKNVGDCSDFWTPFLINLATKQFIQNGHSNLGYFD